MLFELYRPVSMVEKLFPALIAFVPKMEVDDGISFWLDGL